MRHRSPGIGPLMNLIWTPAQLALLAKVVDLNGFSAAARALGVPKAAVSRAVADLERSLGVRVLERTTRRISLTPAGRLLYPHAKSVGDETDAARAAIAKLRHPAPPRAGRAGGALCEAPPALLCATPTYLQQRCTPERPDELHSHELLTPGA